VNVEASRGCQDQSAILHHGELNIIVEPPIGAAALVDVAPRPINDSRISWNVLIFDESGEALFDSEVTICDPAIGSALRVQNYIREEKQFHRANADTGYGEIRLYTRRI
jgi:hypothetical protein